jgi:hypothetical protein
MAHQALSEQAEIRAAWAAALAPKPTNRTQRKPLSVFVRLYRFVLTK